MGLPGADYSFGPVSTNGSRAPAPGRRASLPALASIKGEDGDEQDKHQRQHVIH